MDWIAFQIWLRIETYVFVGSILAGIVYMSVRAFVPNAMDMGDEESCFSERTDHLEANYLAVEMFQAYFSPLVAFILVSYDLSWNVTSDV